MRAGLNRHELIVAALIVTRVHHTADAVADGLGTTGIPCRALVRIISRIVITLVMTRLALRTQCIGKNRHAKADNYRGEGNEPTLVALFFGETNLFVFHG